jgi:hypothetical protein
MVRIIFLGVALAFAAAVAAQAYRWVDKDGRVRYGDTPPPGVQARPLQLPKSGGANVAPSASGDAKKGPLTPAEQEQEFRKRQLEAQKAGQKATAAAQEEEAKQANCARARETLATLQSGRRILRTNAQGEQYYLEDDAREREIQDAQRAVQDWCS